MNKRFLVTLFIFAMFSAWMISCSKAEGETNISTHKEDESHYKGDNCMNCHYQDGAGEGWFSIAGSVYGNYQNHTVLAYDALTQELLASVEIDKLGNLYTTEDVDFKNGIAVHIINSLGDTIRSMSTIVTNGQCNLCHDGTFEEIIEIL